MHGETSWEPLFHQDPDGTYRVEIRDEDSVTWPVGRALTRAQGEALVQRIAAEVAETRKPAKVVIRDPHFMAASILLVKRVVR